jgi:hypothetical protein
MTISWGSYYVLTTLAVQVSPLSDVSPPPSRRSRKRFTPCPWNSQAVGSGLELLQAASLVRNVRR